MTPRTSRNPSLATRLRTVDELVRAGNGWNDNRVTGVTPPLQVARRELWCRVCGYGAIVRGEPPACPMCRATSWVEHGRRAAVRRGVDHAL